jgi:Protein of unknown function (DUF1552)
MKGRTMGRRALSRRTMLRGLLGSAVATVGLPPLEAMLDPNGTALADGSGLPVRFMTYCFGNGVRLDRWIPAAEGPNYPLSEELAPLASVKDCCSIFSGFQNRSERRLTHHEGMTVFSGYTFVEQQGLFSKAGGPTIDQIIADRIQGDAMFRSIQVGISKRLSSTDSGTTLHNLSHRGRNAPLPPEWSPQTLWAKLFGGVVPPDDPSTALRLSVVDAVRADAALLKKRLGATDSQRIDAHLQGLRELEVRLKALPPACTLPPKPEESNADEGGAEPLTAVHTAMVDLLVLAFSCDVTRVASVLVSGGASDTVFSELGQSTGHHTNTHDAGRQEQVHQVVVWHMERLAHLLERLRSTPDGPDRSLLDSALIFCSSDCSEGLTHDIFDQPIVVAGRAGGRVRYPGVHYRSPARENATDVLVSCLQAVDPGAIGVGIGSGAPYSERPCNALHPR